MLPEFEKRVRSAMRGTRGNGSYGAPANGNVRGMVTRIGAVALALTGLIYFTSVHSGNSQGRNVMAAGDPFTAVERNLPPITPLVKGETYHILVTGGAGFIGSHATLRLLTDGHTVTIVDNLSRGNMGAIRALMKFAKEGQLNFVYADLGDPTAIRSLFSTYTFDLVMHFAAVAYVGESMAEPLRYYHNITSNTMMLLEHMTAAGVRRLVYSSTCATYGEPDKMPITEDTPQHPINPYGKSKKMAEDIIRDYARTIDGFEAVLLRYFNVIGSDPEGRLGEAPRPELRKHSRISGACFDAAQGKRDGLDILGTDYPTPDGTCIRDYIHVSDLVDAHVDVMPIMKPNTVLVYNVGVGKGYSVREFVNACLKVVDPSIKVREVKDRRPGDYAEVYSDPTKINTEVGWHAKYTNLEETLAMAWKWQKAHKGQYEDNSPL